MVTIHGNVGGLIALGAGFHPHMTGRENIFLNGAILGLKKSTIERQLTDIIAFADIGEFIDAPVTTYSSGMSVRLGFAIASVQEPQLLLLDEVLAVGDAGFRRKCYNRIGAMQQNAAVILVSHNIEHITRICTKVLVLDHGRPVFLGPVQEGVGRYTDMGHVKGNEDKPFLSCDAPVLSATVDFDCTTIEWDGNINVCLVADSSSRVTNCSVRCVLYDENEMIVAEWNSLRNGLRIDLQRGRNEIQFSIGAIRLKAGVYAVGLVLHDSGSIAHLVWCYKTQQITVTGDQRGMTAYQLGNKRSSAGAPMGAKAETV
jgi:lipopolysaccharide transport system ATP-binding protein